MKKARALGALLVSTAWILVTALAGPAQAAPAQHAQQSAGGQSTGHYVAPKGTKINIMGSGRTRMTTPASLARAACGASSTTSSAGSS